MTENVVYKELQRLSSPCYDGGCLSYWQWWPPRSPGDYHLHHLQSTLDHHNNTAAFHGRLFLLPITLKRFSPSLETRTKCHIVAKDRFSGFNPYPRKTFRFIDASKYGWYDGIMKLSESLIWRHNEEVKKCDLLTDLLSDLVTDWPRPSISRVAFAIRIYSPFGRSWSWHVWPVRSFSARSHRLSPGHLVLAPAPIMSETSTLWICQGGGEGRGKCAE